MKKLANVLDSKRSIAGLFILAGLVFNTYRIQENSEQVKRLSNFESGIQTCFTRVNQSYTANLLGDTASTYLTQNFQNLTEECLAEGILTVENSFEKEMSGAAKQLSTLASNVHWFHEDILAPAVAGTKAQDAQPQGRDVGTRFEKIETTKDDILDSTNNYKAKLTKSLNLQKNVFFVAATLLMVLMLAEFMSLTRRRFSNNAREKEAQAELIDNGGVTSVKVGEIIRVALEQNGLINCSKLFANFHAFAMIEKGKNKMSLETLVAPVGPSIAKAATNKNIERVWEDDSIAITAEGNTSGKMNSVNLEQMSENVVDLLAEKMFSQGVQLNINIPQNLTIRAQNEELEQSLYHLFMYAINSTREDYKGEKNISVFAHKLGDVVAFDVAYTGAGFSHALLKQRAGLEIVKEDLDLDLKIAQALFNEIQAKVQLDNTLNQTGVITGGRVKIIFKAGTPIVESTQNARLVDLKVGSKKEILRALNS